jgi:hypothetical protein
VARAPHCVEFGKIRGEAGRRRSFCYVLDLAAKSKKAPYASGTLWISKEDSLARRARLALRSGKEAKEVRFVAYEKEHGNPVLRRMEILHRLEPERGLRTVLEFLRYAPGAVPDSWFDPARARSAP